MNNEVDLVQLREEVIRLRTELVKTRKEVSLPKIKIRKGITKAIVQLEILINELNDIVI